MDKSINKVDSIEKINGSANYIDDIYLSNMYYARTVRSTKARAKIKNIHIPPLSDNYFIVDKNDIPGKNIVKMILNDFPFFADNYVNYVGEPILLVVGPDKVVIDKIVNKIVIEYEESKPILTIEQSEYTNDYIYENNNIFADYSFEKGDISEIHDPECTIFEDVYETGYHEHVYMEPQGMIGIYQENKLSVYGSIQCPYYVKNALIDLLNINEKFVRVVQTTTGGAFGGKEEYPSLIAGHVALAAIKTKKPVKLIFDRKEDMLCTTKRHPSKIKIKTALNKENKIITADIDIKLDGGAYAGLSGVVLQRSMFASSGVYNIPNLRVRGKVYATNKVPTGAFRGFGSPQSFFAIETHLNNIAMKLGINQLDLKRINLVKTGDSTTTNGTFRDEIILPKMINKIINESDYINKYDKYKNNNLNKGIGISLYYHGCGFTGSGEKDIIKGKLKLKKHQDEKVEILISAVDMGQGVLTTFRKIVSDIIGIPIDNVIYNNPDTDLVPDSGPTVASRTAMIVGGLLAKAAKRMKERWFEDSFEILETYRQPDYIKWDQEKMIGDAYPTYSWGVQVVEIDIDPSTYEININDIWTVHDVGYALDEKIIHGQIHGGVLQGIAYGYLENLSNINGNFLQKNITDYVIPTSIDSPKIHSYLMNVPFEFGPYGAKGAGELPLIGGAPAIVSAIQNALNIPINKIPAIPEYIMEVMINENKI